MLHFVLESTTYYFECKRKNIDVLVGYNLIFLKSIVALKKIYNQNKNDVCLINSKVSYNLKLWRKNISYTKSVSAYKNKGGGVLLELSHDLHYLIWILGKPIWVSSCNTKVSNLKINTEDNALLIVGFKNITVKIELDFINNNYVRFCEIITNKNYFRWDYKINSIFKFLKNKKKFLKIFTSKQLNNDMYIDQLRFFIKNKNKIIFNSLLNVAYYTIKLIDAAKLSNKNDMKKIYLKYE